jgi:hypothetical protein
MRIWVILSCSDISSVMGIKTFVEEDMKTVQLFCDYGEEIASMSKEIKNNPESVDMSVISLQQKSLVNVLMQNRKRKKLMMKG